jgi:hypothetical protein
MSDPVSILTPTYGRTALLGELVESFCRRREPAELVIINDCPLQTLTCRVPGVTLFNVPPIATFGAKRHLLTQCAKHDLMCVWDDDDIYLPGFLTALLGKLRTDEPAARLRHMWRWDGSALKIGSSGMQHATVFRRSAYANAGPWPALPAGEADATFWAHVSRNGWFRGRHHHEADGHLEAIYRAEPSRPQMEGNGKFASEAAYKAAMDQRIAAGLEPVGEIEIIPQWSRDWSALARDARNAGGKAVIE